MWERRYVLFIFAPILVALSTFMLTGLSSQSALRSLLTRRTASSALGHTVNTASASTPAPLRHTSLIYAAMSSSTAGTSSEPQYFTGANGCFWGPHQMYKKHFSGKGLLDAKVGYIGGTTSKPTYESVCSGKTGHAEAIQVKFDPSKVSYAELVEFLLRTHDPTQKDKQGADVGTQYRSAIFPHNAEQLEIARKVVADAQEKHFTPNGKKIVTTLEEQPSDAFHEAENYHQDYLDLNPSGYHCPMHRLWW
ncbi:unnamed protein product [Parajaminaea phylloscopi]